MRAGALRLPADGLRDGENDRGGETDRDGENDERGDDGRDEGDQLDREAGA